jgi:hypothetical protein
MIEVLTGNGVSLKDLSQIRLHRLWRTDPWFCPNCKLRPVVTAGSVCNECWLAIHDYQDAIREFRNAGKGG